MDKTSLKNLIAFALFIGVIIISFIQINNAETVTKTETALFNILQLLFSIGFSWIISSYFSELSFIAAQKKFAIGAFRRIKEIERSLSRAQNLLAPDKVGTKDSQNQQSVMFCLLNAQDAVNSSIADWGDIIGDEIHLTKEISRLKGLRGAADKFEKEYLDNIATASSKESDLENEIKELKSELPASLRIEEENESKMYDMAEFFLSHEINETGEIILNGFWEPKDSFTGDIKDVAPGDTLYISRGYTENRGDALLVFDDNDNWVAVITNKFMSYHDEIVMDYDSFLELFEECIGYRFIPKAFGGKVIPILVTEKDEVNENGYHHFEAILKVEDIPKSA
ncbi:hypothetical protein H5085_03230 [Pseudoalteromonas sp. SR43-6]|uniref:hypothetical protein n=1 Tax=unclassified Pseudoalteromonas TaxID=194690 RepID=UPI0015FA6041|nr:MULTISPECIES: hypothetical protein [unclassified Pseudoalteromonas]MBB1287518.1 hypothetical protein [Pseudoalteromonas sp. SR41-5]MBB1373352.1 hypothetical protein [Pseudoalteromonas sp. SR43-6]MBB1412159.1 hypothetical protein [Pseudoalteromonas sp. SG43-8]